MRPQDLTTAKTVAKFSVVSNTAGGKKSVARRSTGLDNSSDGAERGESIRRSDSGVCSSAFASTAMKDRPAVWIPQRETPCERAVSRISVLSQLA
jgi:hypothetical protein